MGRPKIQAKLIIHQVAVKSAIEILKAKFPQQIYIPNFETDQ
jgi:hypothetical protein